VFWPDADPMVDDEPGHAPPSLGDFLALRDGLATAFGRGSAEVVGVAALRPA
jgi:hypothetical protein